MTDYHAHHAPPAHGVGGSHGRPWRGLLRVIALVAALAVTVLAVAASTAAARADVPGSATGAAAHAQVASRG
ncbi:MAG: hypothetical protein ACRDYU_03300 [Actinomycetes bacterium]